LRIVRRIRIELNGYGSLVVVPSFLKTVSQISEMLAHPVHAFEGPGEYLRGHCDIDL